MKICIISFDFFSFDKNILFELKKRKDIESNHIDIAKFHYKYTSLFDRLQNFFKKVILKKNIKKIKMEKYVLDQLTDLGNQDIILVIRPDCFTKETHLKIKKQSNKYISYIYDSCARFPIDYLLSEPIFDRIYSFDKTDCQKFDFSFITNYIYLEKREIPISASKNNIIFIILSIDERFPFLNKFADYLAKNAIDFKFIVMGKRKPKNINSTIIYTKKPVFIDALITELENSDIFLDLIRKDHNGLSFRIFEALAMQKKIITTNKSISEYDFYNPNNILILDENSEIDINPNFFKTPYQPLSDAVYYKYTIENWVKTIFKL